ncbi:polysaccharide deacetylase family protein [Ramlibacter sp. MMS24-I3-19]|uniref:polysaccharide deacetylase family protein n=1 Tax=Ramlibacter sp. MMS24-I3-19 TaxID=3416606 RepID=UPI003CFF96B3
MTTTRWRPSPFMLLSAACHVAVLVLLVVAWRWWPVLLLVLVVDHLAMTAAGLWPRSTLLGPNVVKLPPAACARREIAITIDDGPDPAVTPQVLDILARHGAKATFFCVGKRAALHPDLCRAIVAAGHDIENHGQRHPNTASLMGARGWHAEIDGAQRTLASITGRPPRFYRAVAGLRNPFLDPVLHRLGLRLATWSARGFDTRCGDPHTVLARLLARTRPGAILLLHDGHAARMRDGAPVIVGTLPLLLHELRERGLNPVTLSQAFASP